jgi:uncharacterized membrane protein
MKNKKILFITIGITALITLNSCKTNQAANTKEVSQNSFEEVEIALPFSGLEYQTNSDFIREKASGSSKYDLETAKSEAILISNGRISDDVEVLMKKVSEVVTSKLKINEKEEFSKELSEVIRSVSKQYLKGTRTIGEKAIKSKKDGTITYWVVRELSMKPILDEIANTISKDQKINQAIKKEEILKMANEELDKMENEKMAQQQSK